MRGGIGYAAVPQGVRGRRRGVGAVLRMAWALAPVLLAVGMAVTASAQTLQIANRGQTGAPGARSRRGPFPRTSGK